MADRMRYYETGGRRRHDGDIRAADSDRETVADILRQQHVVGRLDSDEFQQRLERCLSAKTYAELDQLVADLPGDDEHVRSASRAWVWSRLSVVPLLIAAVIAAAALTGGHLLWLAIPLFFFVVRPLLWRSPSGGSWGCGPRKLGLSGRGSAGSGPWV